jgi:D-glycero-alpha-D-manno-heptose-7-phosphate kinase
LRRALVASAPTRLDFGGGWTDVPPYPEERGGFVCNLAINRRATVRVSPSDVASAPTDRLIRAALLRAGVHGVDVTIESDFPVGAGLGGSSAAGVAMAAALHAVIDLPMTRAALAEWSRAVEVEELQIAGGRQDHYAAAFGGALALTFERETTVSPIAIPARARAALERQCLLVYTGESRISATTITAVLDAYRDRTPRVVHALSRMKAAAVEMATALESGDIDHLAMLVDDHWREQRALHPAITTPRIDAIETAARAAGATALKALGASGGGCVAVFAPDDRVEEVARAVAPFAELLPWAIDDDGVQVRPD